MKPCHTCAHRMFTQLDLGGMHVALWRCRLNGERLGTDREFKAGRKLPTSCKEFTK